jgi:glycosyltransferase involved in cell wall biosynthesis
VHEGFPNTFLEAWSQGVPVVSTFDPDGLIRGRGLGRVASNPADLLAQIEHLTGSNPGWLEVSRKCREYFEQNHLAESVVPKFEAVFLDVASRSSRACTA